MSKLRISDALANKIRLEAKAEIENKIAKTDAIVKANEAQAQEILAKAEELAAKMLKSKRDFDESMTQLDVLGALSTNSSCTVSGNNGDNVVAQLLAAQSSGKVVGLSVTP